MRRYVKYIVIVAALLVVAGAVVFIVSKTNKEREEKQLAYRQEGIEYFEQGDYEKALECFLDALADSSGDIDDTEMDICFYKARALYEMGDTDGAMESYNAVIEYNDDAKAYFLRGNLYYSLGDEENALADFKKAVEKEHKDYDLYIAIYEILAAKNRQEDAKDYLSKALEIKSDKDADEVKLGYINFLLGNNETAIELLEESSAEDPAGYYYLFLVYDAMENSEKALENLNAYMKEEKDLDSYKLYETGTGLLKKSQYTSAIECFKKALELEEVPNKQFIMKSLVVAYEKNLDFTSAKEVMEEYVKEYPEDEEAYREYTFLETR